MVHARGPTPYDLSGVPQRRDSPGVRARREAQARRPVRQGLSGPPETKAASPIKGNAATRLFQAQRFPLPAPPSGPHSRLYAQFEVVGDTVFLRRLVFNVARPGGSSVPEVRLGEPTSRVRQAP